MPALFARAMLDWKSDIYDINTLGFLKFDETQPWPITKDLPTESVPVGVSKDASLEGFVSIFDFPNITF